MRAGCWRFLHANDDKVTACGFRNDVRSRKVAFRPTVWLFREFSVRIINMNGHLCSIDFCSQPEPIFIPFKQLLPHRFPFTRSEVACPVILAHLKSLFLHRVLPPEEQMPARTLWWGPPRRKSQTVAQRWPPTGRSCREGPLRKGSPEISQSFLMMSLPSRVVISLTFLTDSAEMRALPILIRGFTSTKAS